MKRREFAKMRKALLEDERIGKIAENPKKTAFLRAIADRDGEDEMGFLEDLAEPEEGTDSQSQSQTETSQKDVHQPNSSQPDVVMGPPKRKLFEDAEPSNRLPPHLRRTKLVKRPSNLSEIRQSLSSLIEDPNAVLESQDLVGSDSEAENDLSDTERMESMEKENRDPFASRRKKRFAVVDRISLKRASSNATSMTTRLAFVAPSASDFKVPALLRRTTTSTSITSGSSSGVSGTERTTEGFGDNGKLAKKAGKNSGVHYFSRENEKRRKVEESEMRRKEKRFKGAEGRRKVVGGLFGLGKFE
jgi:mediator of replication checkpoint protein 1